MFTRPIRRLIRSTQKLLQLLVSIPQRIASAIATWFVRRAVRAKRGYRRSAHWSNAGFVLPTAVLLTLVVALTVGALTFRTFSRTSDVITERQQRVIQNAATPAIDRAKAKIEKLFEDSRYPGGVPSSDVLISMMKNETANGITALNGVNPYIFPDETAIETGSAALTWQFEDDAGHDVIYSITIDDENDDASVSIASSDADKAAEGVVRNGPISMQELRAACERSNFSREPEGGWYPVNTADVRRVFQVDAYVADENNGRVAALEFQQDRQVSRGNKWGAWFRTDLEVFPLPNFMWNGAMHTEGSIIAKDNIFAHLVSSPASCVYSKDASEITSAEYLAGDEDNDETAYQGQFVFGVIGADNFSGSDSKFHLFDENDPITNGTSAFNASKDSIGTGNSVSAISLNPTELFTNNKSVARGTGWARDGAWQASNLKQKRLDNSKVPIPFLDDTFRADNRFGPKPEYKDRDPDQYNLIAMGETIGNPIPSTREADLLSMDGGEGTDFGLDGYWERRALVQGIRTIVGERLELGNHFGWQGADNALTGKKGDLNGDGVINASDATPTLLTPGYLTEPLYPSATTPTFSQTFGADNSSTFQQNRTLRDNLAAAQAMAVYRYSEGDLGKIPMACVAVTSHNGTVAANQDSRKFSFVDIPGVGLVPEIKFLEGKGTNGWEFPFVATSEGNFETKIGANAPLGIALRNLANFAGDENGGAPSFTPDQDSTDTYPNNYMKMWGDFSMLRRILDSGTSYANLSPADKSTLHTAACTLSMLAYSLELDNKSIVAPDFYENIKSQFTGGNLAQFAGEIVKLMDGIATAGNPEFYTGAPAAAIAALHVGKPNAADYVPVAPTAWNDTINNSATPATPPAPGEIRVPISTCTTTDTFGSTNAYNRACDAADYFKTLGRVNSLTGAPIPLTLPEIKAAVLTQYPAPQRPGVAAKFDLLESFVKNDLVELFQVLRDRTLGFKYGAAPIPPGYNSTLVDWNPETGLTGDVDPSNNNFALQVGCDPDIFDKLMAPANTSVNAGLTDEIAALSLAFCNSDVETFKEPKYPALYYLFPVVSHDLFGTNTTGNANYDFNHTQPLSEEYIHYVKDYDGYDDTYTYQPLKPGQDGLTGFSNIDFDGGLLSLIGDGDTTFESTDAPLQSGWELPYDDSPDANAPNLILNESGNLLAAVPFMDHQYYDGRELMNLRMLAYDMSLLTGAGNGDFIRDDETVNDIGSVIYAFREDAVREDEIIRPSSQDPAITAANGISTKPVDFVADPDRRAHGFALIRGADLNRDNNAGMTFVSDNSVMIQGNFNLHSGNGQVSGIMEEFTDTLMANVNLGANGSDAAYTNAFYGRTALNDDFAEPTQDHWRPVEILGDSVVFVSDGFLSSNPATSKAGTVDTFLTNNSRKSYRAMRYPIQTPTPDYREGGDSTAPYEFDRDGYPLVCAGTCSRSTATRYSGNFFAITDGNNANRLGQLPDAGPNNSRIYINATVVSGIVPSQAGQSNGGLHNLPRFVENWEDVDVVFAGAFFQLNFSTYATAPWDDNPGLGSGNNFVSNFYSAPNRRWGYDVGLLYAPAGPVAQRFVTPSSNRSEFYRELPSSDPYIDRLRNLLAG